MVRWSVRGCGQESGTEGEWRVWSGSGEGCSHVVRIGEGCDQVSDVGCGHRWKGVVEVWSGLWSGVSAE